MPLETLLLDAGGVMIFPNWDRVAVTLRSHGFAVTGDALRAVEPPAKRAIDEARRIATSDDAQRGGQYFDLVLDAAGVSRTAARAAALAEIYAYHQSENIWETVPADVRPALGALRDMGLTLAVASNANGILHRLFDRVGLTPYFDVICDSCIEGVEKPDPRFFEIVMERAGGRRESTLHVGDLYHVDVAGARNAGIAALLLDPHDLYADTDVDRIRSLSELVDTARRLRREVRNISPRDAADLR
jgi:HAD superfamily hydrolase (TIGR01509 family)